MREVTQKVCKAFIEGRSAWIKHTRTDGQALYLHGHKIVWKDGNGYHFSLCGWNTPTTRDRINGVFTLLNLQFRLFQHKGDLYLNLPKGGLAELSSCLPYSVSDFY